MLVIWIQACPWNTMAEGIHETLIGDKYELAGSKVPTVLTFSLWNSQSLILASFFKSI